MTGSEEMWWGDVEGRNPVPLSASLPPTLVSHLRTNANEDERMSPHSWHSLAPWGIARGRNLQENENSLGQTEDQHLRLPMVN